jgi:hypothetical protein
VICVIQKSRDLIPQLDVSDFMRWSHCRPSQNFLQSLGRGWQLGDCTGHADGIFHRIGDGSAVLRVELASGERPAVLVAMPMHSALASTSAGFA